MLHASSRTLNIGVLALTLTTARLASGAMTVNDDVDIVKTPEILLYLFEIQKPAWDQGEPDLRPVAANAVWLRLNAQVLSVLRHPSNQQSRGYTSKNNWVLKTKCSI